MQSNEAPISNRYACVVENTLGGEIALNHTRYRQMQCIP